MSIPNNFDFHHGLLDPMVFSYGAGWDNPVGGALLVSPANPLRNYGLGRFFAPYGLRLEESINEGEPFLQVTVRTTEQLQALAEKKRTSRRGMGRCG